MLDFLRRNLFGEYASFEFVADGENVVAFLDDVYVDQVDQDEKNEEHYIINREGDGKLHLYISAGCAYISGEDKHMLEIHAADDTLIATVILNDREWEVESETEE